MTKHVLSESIIQFLGVEHRENVELLEFLVDSEERLAEFMKGFYDGRILLNIMNYRLHRQALNRVSREEFGVLYNKNKTKALEKLFQEPVYDTHLNFIDIHNVTWGYLYGKHIIMPNELLINIIKGNYIENVDMSDDFLIEM